MARTSKVRQASRVRSTSPDPNTRPRTRSAMRRITLEADADKSPDTTAPIPSPQTNSQIHASASKSSADSDVITTSNIPSILSCPSGPDDRTQPSSSQSESHLADLRRQTLRALQATLYPHLAGIAEPDLNDAREVRHFEVDSQGSLTFLLLGGGEAWRLKEIGLKSLEHGQMIVGRFYAVERVR